MSLSSTPGAVQSRFPEISQELQSNQGQVSISITWGIERQSQQRVTYNQTFLAIPQTLAARGNAKSPQSPSHRMISQQEFNL